MPISRPPSTQGGFAFLVKFMSSFINPFKQPKQIYDPTAPVQHPDNSQYTIKKSPVSSHFRLTKRVWCKRWAGLCPSERCILQSLWLYHGKNGKVYPSLTKIALELNLNRHSVIYHINQLQQKGHLKIVKTAGKVNHYLLTPLN